VADVIRQYGEEYLRTRQVPSFVEKTLKALAACRTADLGGHASCCDHCGQTQVWYNSCRDRHCPKCQAAARAQWLEARCQELLPVEYFHLVFTLPHELATLVRANRRALLDLLFRASAETLLELAADTKRLGATIGFLSVLHTWGQNLEFHPHVHCVVTGGGPAPDGSHWVACRPGYFLPVQVLSRLFRGKFLAGLKKLEHAGQLRHDATITDTRAFQAWLAPLYQKEWVVHAKPPFGGPEQVLKYLARYTHRVAISNDRLVSLANGRVTFRWKNYARGQQWQTMTLEAVEFLRRFAEHITPPRFVRMRYYGTWANAERTARLEQCRRLLAAAGQPTQAANESPPESPDIVDRSDEPPRCPHCGVGYLWPVVEWPRPTIPQLLQRPWWRPVPSVSSRPDTS
jgi:hypothetical protein